MTYLTPSAADSLWLKDVTQAEQLNIGAALVPANLDEQQAGLPFTTINNVNVYQLTPAPRASTQGTSTYQAISPTHTRILVDVPADTTLTVRDSYYKDWHAYVDDVEVPIQKADTIFRQINITAGKHQVDMYYRPTVLYIGIAISALAITLCGLLVLKSKQT